MILSRNNIGYDRLAGELWGPRQVAPVRGQRPDLRLVTAESPILFLHTLRPSAHSTTRHSSPKQKVAALHLTLMR